MFDKKTIVSAIRKKKLDLDEARQQGEATVEKLGLLDTYPDLGNSESDTPASEDGYGQGELKNEITTDDQEEVRRKFNRVRDIFNKVAQKHRGG